MAMDGPSRRRDLIVMLVDKVWMVVEIDGDEARATEVYDFSEGNRRQRRALLDGVRLRPPDRRIQR
jgi:hypothetical protein